MLTVQASLIIYCLKLIIIQCKMIHIFIQSHAISLTLCFFTISISKSVGFYKTKMDERPICPNKEYLEQKEKQFHKKTQHQYLKKQADSEKILPCFRKQIQQNKQTKCNNDKQVNQKTKAELYEEIKKKNRQKFGPIERRSKEKVNEKKIDPKRITVNYKSKNQRKIDLTQYRKIEKGESELPQENPEKKLTMVKEQTAKEKYEKLLQILKAEKQALNQQKEQFNNNKDVIDFKSSVKDQQSLPFIQQMRKKVKKEHESQHTKKLQKSHIHATEAKNDLIGDTSVSKKIIDNSGRSSKANYPTKLSKMNDEIANLSIYKSDLEGKIAQKSSQQHIFEVNHSKVIDEEGVVCTKFSIFQLDQIPEFNIECFKDFMLLETLEPEKNYFYQKTLETFEMGLSKGTEQRCIGEVGDSKLLTSNKANSGREPSNDALISFKRRFEGDKRITKYENDWIEVWTPGHQRLMANKRMGYKVVWLKNGDIKQQWTNKGIVSYYSCEKDVVEILFEEKFQSKGVKFQPIYFYIKLRQLEQISWRQVSHGEQKSVKKTDTKKSVQEQQKVKTKIVMFRDGRIEQFEQEQEESPFFL